MSNIDYYFVYLDNESAVKPKVKPQIGPLQSEGIVFLFLPEWGLMNDTQESLRVFELKLSLFC